MARLNPAAVSMTSARADGGLQRELDVLQFLCDRLPEDYEIFHEVHWQRSTYRHDEHGEIDIVVMSPRGHILLIEVKAGHLVPDETGLFKVYGRRKKNITRQCQVQYGAMVSRLKSAELFCEVIHLLVLPDYRLDQQEQIVAVAPQRIIDAAQYLKMPQIIQALMESCTRPAESQKIRRFLCNEFNVSPDVGVFQQHLKKLTRNLSDGLAVWVPRIQHHSGICQIHSTAGSGKTQLALHLLQQVHDQKRRALYVCYNRPLADHMQSLAGTEARAVSFYELVIAYYRHFVQTPDFNNPDLYQDAVEYYCQHAHTQTDKVDVLLIDESQDFKPEWISAVRQLLQPDGRLYLMGDEAQCLYSNAISKLENAVTITSHDNYRTPKVLCQMINALALTEVPIISRNPYQGNFPEISSYQSTNALLEQTRAAVQHHLDHGFKLEDIAIITWHGYKNSALLSLDSLGPWSTRRFTGDYSEEGKAVWTQGQLHLESVYRFKGQSAPAVIFTEIDFTQLDDKSRRKLFVGMTRAQLALNIVLSAQAEQTLVTLLQHNE